MSDGERNAKPAYSCLICHKRYKRSGHLARHVTTHSIARPFPCSWCGSSYQRADVLRRHALTCLGREALTGKATVASRRRRACDSCVRQKKACTGGLPCSNCRRKSLECISSHLTEQVGTMPGQAGCSLDLDNSPGGSQNMALPDADPMMPPVAPPVLPPFALGDTLPFAYLGSSLSASDLFAYDHANNENWVNFLNLAADTLPPDLPEPNDYSFHFLDNFTSRTGLVESFDCGTEMERHQVVSVFLQALMKPTIGQPVTNPDPASTSPTALHTPRLQDNMALKTYEILLRVKDIITKKPRNSSVTLQWSPGLEQRCLQFFSPNNIRKFLALYWEIWHPNVNFVHRPSFDPANAKPALVAAMILIGASVSPDVLDVEQAKQWYNCIEEMVFTDEDFCSDCRFTDDTTPWTPSRNMREIEALQAAYMVARDIGIMSARHADYSMVSQYEFDWKDFVSREQLIRIFLWIFLLDNAFVIFNNLPPRMVIQEMAMHMAWPEALFQAATADECAQQLQVWLRRSALTNMTVRDAVNIFCNNNIEPNIRVQFADLGPLNLFTIVSGINMWKRIGFMRHSPEFWLLATVVVDRISSTSDMRWGMGTAILGDSGSGSGTSAEPILAVIDQTSMRQVNDLITEFQNMPKRDIHLQLQKWAKQYGPVYSLILGTQTLVVLSSDQAVKDLLDRRSSLYSHRQEMYVGQKLASGDLRLLMMFRKMVHGLLNSQVSKEYVPYQVLENKQMLHDMVVQPEQFLDNIRRYSNSLTTTMVFGWRTPMNNDKKLIQLFEGFSKFADLNQTGVAALLDSFPMLRKLPEFFLPLQQKARDLHQKEKALYLSHWLKAKEEFANGTIKPCFCIGLAEAQKKHGFSDQQAAYISGTLLEAGSDTTSNTLYAWVQAMLLYPDVQKAAQQEIDDVVGDDRLPSIDDQDRLQYVRMCMKETLRWMPTTILGAVPHAVTQDDIYNGFLIPKGAGVLNNVWSIHMDEDRHPEPRRFNPERYRSDTLSLGDSASSGDPTKRDQFTFGSGRRICPGIHVAERSLFLGISRMLWAFNIEPALDEAGEPILPDPDKLTQGFVCMPEEFPAKITPRSEAKKAKAMQDWEDARSQFLDPATMQWLETPLEKLPVSMRN
ncbi:hypothetical protein LRP88_02200 [Fusarium phalaenopsidis]